MSEMRSASQHQPPALKEDTKKRNRPEELGALLGYYQQVNMARSKLRARRPLVEAAVGFALAAVAGCVLGATEDPVDRTISAMTSEGFMKPVMDEARTVGPLGLGTLLGATALTASMSSAAAGVILAAATASVFLSTGSCGVSDAKSVGLWVWSGLAGALGATLSGATQGVVLEWIVNTVGMVGLLWALSVFTLMKPPLHFLFKVIWQQREVCCGLGQVALARERDKREMETKEAEQRERVAVQVEQRILALEKGARARDREYVASQEEELRQREEMERRRIELEEAEMEHRTVQDWIDSVVVKYVAFMAFSGLPMTLLAVVTTVFGVCGYGAHQSALIGLLCLVVVLSYALMKASSFKFWMLAACMGMLATFVVAVLTLHAEQEVVIGSSKMRAAGQNLTRESVASRMNYKASLEAMSAGFFVAKLCQLALGATVGGPLLRWGAGEAKVIVGAAGAAGALLLVAEVTAPVLGQGGRAGALLGAVGAAGVSVGAAAAMAGAWSSWAGTLGSLLGLVLGALVMGKWHMVNIGLQLPVAYVFAMTNPY
ncbi:hypothetical protein NHX12_001431 [Muraenolepis orangiensis]|uniref:Uncharacterized protein n=1 Tax=Muraenolepis orangiensis TaxID=630683 RepID=A0A9Q0DZP1_9TELE|nr:hypothetical protein NHX12_001431 [Muraenolepis orangiensis]